MVQRKLVASGLSTLMPKTDHCAAGMLHIRALLSNGDRGEKINGMANGDAHLNATERHLHTYQFLYPVVHSPSFGQVKMLTGSSIRLVQG